MSDIPFAKSSLLEFTSAGRGRFETALRDLGREERRLGQRAVRLHEEGRSLLRPRHHGRPGPRPHRLVGRTLRPRAGRPGQHPVPLGVRKGFRFSLETGKSDQHSGTCGGAARNPLAELCQVLNECADGRTGRVRIPGFYEDVVPPSPRELQDLRRCASTILSKS